MMFSKVLVEEIFLLHLILYPKRAKEARNIERIIYHALKLNMMPEYSNDERQEEK